MKTTSTLRQLITVFAILLVAPLTHAQGIFSGDRHYRINTAALVMTSISAEVEQLFGEHFSASVSAYIKPRYIRNAEYFWDARALNIDARYFPWGANRGERQINLYMGMGMQWSYRHSVMPSGGGLAGGSLATTHQRTGVGFSPSLGCQIHRERASLNLFAAPVFDFYEHRANHDYYYTGNPILRGFRFGVFVGI